MTTQHRVLYVDDDANLLAGLERTLFDVCDVTTALGGALALEKIRKEGPFDVVVSDMRMPGMDGAAFLSQVRRVAPESVRVLLTGQTDLDSAIAAVNEGRIFRFLQKPCRTEEMQQVLDACFRQHDLERAERELLERTLQGAVRVLAETVALGCPSIGQWTAETQRWIDHVVGVLCPEDSWKITIAASLAHLGCAAIPGDVVERALEGKPLAAGEEKAWHGQGDVAYRLLRDIPRLEPVAEIVRGFRASESATSDPTVELGVRLLRLGDEVTRRHRKGSSVRAITAELRGRFPDDVLDALATFPEPKAPTEIVRVKARELRLGMVVAEDVMIRDGAVLVPSGQEVTMALLERMLAFVESKRVGEPIAVFKPVT